MLPARFDDTPLPGLLSNMVTVDLRGRTPQQLAAMIAAKLATIANAVPDGGPGKPNGEPDEPRREATSRDSKIASYKRGATSSNPVAPTR